MKMIISKVVSNSRLAQFKQIDKNNKTLKIYKLILTHHFQINKTFENVNII